MANPCLFCGGEAEAVADMVESVVTEAFLRNCEITFVAPAQGEQLEELGGIGALLRFAG